MTAALTVLTLARARVPPALSAAVLPVLFHVADPVFPLAVAVMSAGLALTVPHGHGSAQRARAWPIPAVLGGGLVILVWSTVALGVVRLPAVAVAPPLMVAALEGVITGSAARAQSWCFADVARRAGLLTGAMALGIVATQSGSYAWVSGAVTIGLVAIIMSLANLPLPPALAVVVVPYVAGLRSPIEATWCVALGSAVLLLSGWAVAGALRSARRVIRPGPAELFVEAPGEEGSRVREDTIDHYLSELAAREPTPGGGAVAALHAAQAAALVAMVARYSEGGEDPVSPAGSIAVQCDRLREKAMNVAGEDRAAFAVVSAAFKAPRLTADDAAARRESISAAMLAAAMPPAAVIRTSADVLTAAEALLPTANRNLLSDIAVAADAARAAATSGRINILVNLKGRRPQDIPAELDAALSTVDLLTSRADDLSQQVLGQFDRRTGL